MISDGRPFSLRPWRFLGPIVYCFEHFLNRHLCKDVVLLCNDGNEREVEKSEKSEPGSVAAILERELEPTVREWLRQVKLVSELTDIPLSDADRAGHLTK